MAYSNIPQRIINKSISEGIFPAGWKEAVVTPILKKGNPEEKYNNRPVSCKTVCSKVPEKIVCKQITKIMDQYGMLPENQHGFRAGRSTMSPLSIQWGSEYQTILVFKW